jgi:hypothetical protein
MRKHSLAAAEDLLVTERLITDAMWTVRFGRFESIPILRGEMVLDPWPTCLRDIKFGSDDCKPLVAHTEFSLQRPLIELFEYVRSVDSGTIRTLVFRHGVPLTMQVDERLNAEVKRDA